jgi:hypothetical protein
MRQVTHKEYQEDYSKGYKSKIEEIHDMGWDNARDKFNLDYPRNHKPSNSGAYYYSQGEIDALADEI